MSQPDKLNALVLVVIIIVFAWWMSRPMKFEDFGNAESYSTYCDDEKSLLKNTFYSLYGWRTNPPLKYPQSTINTPYDKAMDACVSSNNLQLLEPGQWQTKCSLAAATIQRHQKS